MITIPSIGQLNWEEIFHKHRHRPASDILWMATWERLPVGRPVATIAPDKDSCPWCPNEKHNTLHLLHQCHIAQSLWDTAHMIFTCGANSQPPPYTPHPDFSPQQLRLLRSIQSATITSLWNSFTTRAFGHNPTPSHTDIINTFLSRLLMLRSLDLQIDPGTPWISIQKIYSLTNSTIDRYTPPT